MERAVRIPNKKVDFRYPWTIIGKKQAEKTAKLQVQSISLKNGRSMGKQVPRG